ncbi:MAG: c-type cytochrome [Reichenbachiella sp.]
MKILKIIGITLISLAILAFGFIYLKINDASDRLNASYTIEPQKLEISNDSLSLAIGEKWVTALCAECHGEDLGGKLFFDDPSIGKVYSPNITPGPGGTAYYSDADWVRALRHGVAANGKALFIMPSGDYNYMNEEDLAATIAFIKNVPPIERENGINQLTTLANVLISTGGFGEHAIPAEVIDHEAEIPKKPDSQSVIEYGDYVVKVFGCWSCHGKDLSGANSPDPNAPPAPSIRSSGKMGGYSFDQFQSFALNGKTTDGRELTGKFMPWMAIGRLPLEEQKAIFEYLKSLE